MARSDYLFSSKDLGALIRNYEPTIRDEVERWERNKVLSASEPDLIQFLVDKYSLDAPRILADQLYIESEGDTKIDVSHRWEYDVRDRNGPYHVPGSFVTVAIPFEGDPDLLDFQPNTYTMNPPRGRVAGGRILISFQDVKLDPQQVRQNIDSTVAEIEKYLGWIKNSCEDWNTRLPSVAATCVQGRKARLLEQADMVSAIGLPIKRSDAPAAGVSVPVMQKKRPIKLPPTPKEAFKPEPLLPDAEYDFILEIIERLSQSIERSPSTFEHMSEEQIRDLILVNLNGHYEGCATGETFNANGKTDILIRAEGRNAFIAECKFWTGPKGFLAAIDQILGYLTWRDTKAALLIFSRNADFTNVVHSIGQSIVEHPNFKREIKRISDTHVRYLFCQNDDPERDLYLAVEAFNLPQKANS